MNGEHSNAHAPVSTDLVTIETDVTVNEFMRNNREDGPPDSFRVVAKIECRDGFRISVQGHYGAYCAPRRNGERHYYQVECGYPSAPVPELARYKDGDQENRETDTESVYGYVPVSEVADLLNKHGGIKGPYVYPEKVDG